MARIKGELAALARLTPEEAESEATKAYIDAEAERLKRIQKQDDLRKAYEAMLDKAFGWKVPTKDHLELRNFMIKQISESIDFDCTPFDHKKETPRLSGQQWAANRAAELAKSLSYHSEQHAKELERAQERTAWVQALRKSLADDSQSSATGADAGGK